MADVTEYDRVTLRHAADRIKQLFQHIGTAKFAAVVFSDPFPGKVDGAGQCAAPRDAAGFIDSQVLIVGPAVDHPGITFDTCLDIGRCGYVLCLKFGLKYFPGRRDHTWLQGGGFVRGICAHAAVEDRYVVVSDNL